MGGCLLPWLARSRCCRVVPVRRPPVSLSNRNEMSSQPHSGAEDTASIDHAPADRRSAGKRQALELFRGLPARYDALSAALSFWQDPRWRRALVRAAAPRAGDRVLDVATGTGMVAAELLARCGKCAVVGIDQSPAMLAAARERFAAL